MRKTIYQLIALGAIMFTAITHSIAQTEITGRVIELGGQPAEGATVGVDGTTILVTADEKGAFSFTVKKPFPIKILVSYVGYKEKEVLISAPLTEALEIGLTDLRNSNEVVVSSRRRKEASQAVPIAVSILGGAQIEDAGAFNVNRLKELVPTVQLYSSNPRNTTLNIRGLGSTFGLTNDGIDPGVGFYVDGVYYARPAATTLDFVDIDQVEVLRGPQGTLFGKNTTSGAFNITTRPASFRTGATAELSYGNFGFIQAKTSVTGGITDKLAGRISFSGTHRNGLIEHVGTNKNVNTLNNLGARAQLLYKASEKIEITFNADMNSQRPDGYAQVLAGVVTTQRAAFRQFENIIADLNYSPVSYNAFDRKIDHNTAWNSDNDLGGVALNIDAKIGKGTLTSTTAYRYWNWGPSNDRDFTGLAVLSLSQAPSKHKQWSQEIRYAGNISKNLSGVIGIYALGQNLVTNPYHTEESGDAQWRFSQSTTNTAAWSTPGLLDGYGIRTTSNLDIFSGAAFGQLDWKIGKNIHVLPGLRWNYDTKSVNFNRQTYGGLETTDPVLLAIKRSVYTDQKFDVEVDERNFSGQLTVAYQPSESLNAFVTYATGFKPVGVNLGGLPTANGQPMLELARIEPEFVKHFEAGVKTMPNKNTILNLVFHHSNIENYQTQVQTAEVGVNRGYLANAEEVRVWGVELDGSIRLNKTLNINGAFAYTDGIYVSFTNAPVPLEEVGGRNAFKDISGEVLPGISKWSGSLGSELTSKKSKTFMGNSGKLFAAADIFYRSSFSSSPSPSQFLNVDGYALVNSRLGFRSTHGISAFLWVRNLFDVNYFEQLLPAAGSPGHFAGVLGDQRTFGVTLRYQL
jgi:iron complex outermembrane recepter protein